MAKVHLTKTYNGMSGEGCDVPDSVLPILEAHGFIKGKPAKPRGQEVDRAAYESRNVADFAQEKASVKSAQTAIATGKKSKPGIPGKEETAALAASLAKKNADAALADAQKRSDQLAAQTATPEAA